MSLKPSGHISLFGLIFFVTKSLLEISRLSALDPIFTRRRTVFCLYITLRWYFKLEMFHPRRPRGSQSGREKRWDESFQIRAKDPLGTDCHRTISKNSSWCRFLIGHKKCFVLLCEIGEQFLLSSFREGKLGNLVLRLWKNLSWDFEFFYIFRKNGVLKVKWTKKLTYFLLSLYLHQTLKRTILSEIWVKIFLPQPL